MEGNRVSSSQNERKLGRGGGGGVGLKSSKGKQGGRGLKTQES